jgi:hypothetical protein
MPRPFSPNTSSPNSLQAPQEPRDPHEDQAAITKTAHRLSKLAHFNGNKPPRMALGSTPDLSSMIKADLNSKRPKTPSDVPIPKDCEHLSEAAKKAIQQELFNNPEYIISSAKDFVQATQNGGITLEGGVMEIANMLSTLDRRSAKALLFSRVPRYTPICLSRYSLHDFNSILDTLPSIRESKQRVNAAFAARQQRALNTRSAHQQAARDADPLTKSVSIGERNRLQQMIEATDPKKSPVFPLALYEYDRLAVNDLSEYYGINKSLLIRTLIRVAHRLLPTQFLDRPLDQESDQATRHPSSRVSVGDRKDTMDDTFLLGPTKALLALTKCQPTETVLKGTDPNVTTTMGPMLGFREHLPEGPLNQPTKPVAVYDTTKPIPHLDHFTFFVEDPDGRNLNTALLGITSELAVEDYYIAVKGLQYWLKNAEHEYPQALNPRVMSSICPDAQDIEDMNEFGYQGVHDQPSLMLPAAEDQPQPQQRQWHQKPQQEVDNEPTEPNEPSNAQKSSDDNLDFDFS